MGFNCKKNCGECCGPVFFNKKLFEKHKNKLNPDCEIIQNNDEIVVIQNENGRCGFIDNDTAKCKIYEDRPQTCKNYGLIERLPCPYFKPNGNKRSKAMEKRIHREAKKHFYEFEKSYERRLLCI